MGLKSVLILMHAAYPVPASQGPCAGALVGTLLSAKGCAACCKSMVPFITSFTLLAFAGQAAGTSMESVADFPFLCLLVSGGHNLLLTVHSVGDYTLLGATLDDALGETV